MSWVEKQDTVYTLKFSEAINNGWTEPITISSSSQWFVNWADYPMLVTNDSGKFMAHVLEKSGPGKFSYDINVMVSTNKGKTWERSFLLNDDGLEAEHGFVSMVPWKGNVLLAWLDGRQTAGTAASEGDHSGHHGSMSLRAAVRDYEGQRKAEWLIDDRTCDCCQTTAAVFEDSPVVIYRDRSETEVRDMSVSRLADSIWSAPQPVHADGWEVKGCPVNGPRVAVNDSRVATTWFTAAQNQPAVYASLSSDGGKTFGERIRIDEGKANGRVDITAVGQDFIISWLEGEEIKVRKLFQDGRTGDPLLVAKTSSSRPSGFPQLTTLSGEKILVAWTNIEEKRVMTRVVTLD